jgi:hypothetical protein
VTPTATATRTETPVTACGACRRTYLPLITHVSTSGG